jgi:hypothetical protein
MKATTRVDILFDSEKFNLSQVREHYINDCCFGDDAAAWLVEQLRAKGLDATDPDQEDWGWYFEVRCEDESYFVGVGGTVDDDSTGDRGLWRLMVEKHRTLWEKLTGANLVHPNDALLAVLTDIVSTDQELTLVGIE